MSLGIFLLLFGLWVYNSHNANLGAATKGLADVVADQLRQARQMAMARRHPVAVAIPSNNGSAAHSQSLYLLDGVWQPRVTAVHNFSTEYPGADLFVGVWNLDTSALQDSSSGNTTTPASYNGNSDSWSVGSWSAPYPNDYIFAFTPSGTVVTNGLNLFDNAYHILVSSGVGYAGNPAQLSAASLARTVTVSPSGAVTVQTGVAAADSSVQVGSTPPTTPGSPAMPPATVEVSAGAPSFSSVTVVPQPIGGTLPNGAAATCNLDKYLTVQSTCTSTNGNTLYLNWSAAKLTGNATSAGVFSYPLETPMEPSSSAHNWSSTWHWYPPLDAQVGDTFQLTCTVSDHYGGSATSSFTAGAVTGVVQMLAKGKIAVGCVHEYSPINTANPTGATQVWTMNSDGTDMSMLTTTGGVPASWSADGSKLLFGANNQLYMMNADGSGVTAIPNTTGATGDAYYGPGVWSRDGTHIAFVTNFYTPHIYVVNADGSNLRDLGPPPENNPPPPLGIPNAIIMGLSWSIDGQRLAFGTQAAFNVYNVWELSNFLSGSPPTANILTTGYMFPVYSPTGNQMAFLGPYHSSNSGSAFASVSVATYAPPTKAGDPGTLSNFQQIYSDSGSGMMGLSYNGAGNRLIWCEYYNPSPYMANGINMINTDGTNYKWIGSYSNFPVAFDWCLK